MSFKENAEEIGLIVDLMVLIGFAVLYIFYGGIFMLFVWCFSLIITRYLAMRRWKRCINTLKEIVKK